jgi:hypothetical protein
LRVESNKPIDARAQATQTPTIVFGGNQSGISHVWEAAHGSPFVESQSTRQFANTLAVAAWMQLRPGAHTVRHRAGAIFGHVAREMLRAIRCERIALAGAEPFRVPEHSDELMERAADAGTTVDGVLAGLAPSRLSLILAERRAATAVAVRRTEAFEAVRAAPFAGLARLRRLGHAGVGWVDAAVRLVAAASREVAAAAGSRAAARRHAAGARRASSRSACRGGVARPFVGTLARDGLSSAATSHRQKERAGRKPRKNPSRAHRACREV